MLRCACDPDSPCLELIFILFFFQHVTLVVLTVKKREWGGNLLWKKEAVGTCYLLNPTADGNQMRGRAGLGFSICTPQGSTQAFETQQEEKP